MSKIVWPFLTIESLYVKNIAIWSTGLAKFKSNSIFENILDDASCIANNAFDLAEYKVRVDNTEISQFLI